MLCAFIGVVHNVLGRKMIRKFGRMCFVTMRQLCDIRRLAFQNPNRKRVCLILTCLIAKVLNHC